MVHPSVSHPQEEAQDAANQHQSLARRLYGTPGALLQQSVMPDEKIADFTVAAMPRALHSEDPHYQWAVRPRDSCDHFIPTFTAIRERRC